MNRVRTWGPLILWMGLIFYLSSQSSFPIRPTGIWDMIDDYVAHVALYAVLGGLAFRAFHAEGISPKQAAWMALVFCVAYGVSDEWHQSFVPNRTPSVLDLVADTLGAGLAVWMAYRRMGAWQEEA